MNDIFNARRKALQDALTKAALDLSQHTGSAALLIDIPNSNLVAAFGTKENVRNLVK